MRRYSGSTSLLVGVLALATWTVVGAQQATSPYVKASGAAFGNADAIGQDELKAYQYFLASDELEGRNTPSRGYDTAARYIASHLREWGLKPLGAATGDPLSSYLVPIDLVANQMDPSSSKLTLTLPAAGARGGRGATPAASDAPVTRVFDNGREWTAGAGGGARGGATPADIAAAPLVFVGNGYVINKSNTNPYQGLEVRGKFLVVAGLPPELASSTAAAAGQRGGQRGANPLGVENTDFVSPQTYAAKNGAVGIIMIPTFQQLSAMNAPPAPRASLNGPSYQVVRFQAGRAAAVPTITAGLDLTNALFQGETFSGAQVFNAAAANGRLPSFDLSAQKKVSLKIAVNAEQNRTYNVMAMLEGRDPALRQEYVVISAHLDHVGLAVPDANGDAVRNGADDDASGCAALMALARAYASGVAKGIRPKRSVIFLWVTGEEKGLWGSQYFNQFPPVDISKVVADLNMDMVGRSKTPGYTDPPSYKLAEPNEIFVVGPRIASDDMAKVLKTVNDGYLKMKINDFYDTVVPDATHDNIGPGTSGQRLFYRSDHYNFVKVGIPIICFTVGLHTDYHQVGDSADKIDYDKLEAVSKTLYALSWTIGNSTARPRLNSKLPDQLVGDMKSAKDAGWGVGGR